MLYDISIFNPCISLNISFNLRLLFQVFGVMRCGQTNGLQLQRTVKDQLSLNTPYLSRTPAAILSLVVLPKKDNPILWTRKRSEDCQILFL